MRSTRGTLSSYHFLTNTFELILVTGVHPRLVDRKFGKPLLKEAKEHFPEWSEEEVTRDILLSNTALICTSLVACCFGASVASDQDFRRMYRTEHEFSNSSLSIDLHGLRHEQHEDFKPWSFFAWIPARKISGYVLL